MFCRRQLFSATFRYALLSLLEIAGSQDGVIASMIARRHSIPAAYLSTVLRDLCRLGLIRSQKGHRGGYTLARHAADIDLLTIQQGLAGSSDAAFGVDDSPSAADLWLQRMERRWLQELASTTLVDVLSAIDP